LPDSRRESERISRIFDQVEALYGPGATEKALVAALPRRHVVHIAAHGVAVARFDNQFRAWD
jgi:CHAT domain-containing protein